MCGVWSYHCLCFSSFLLPWFHFSFFLWVGRWNFVLHIHLLAFAQVSIFLSSQLRMFLFDFCLELYILSQVKWLNTVNFRLLYFLPNMSSFCALYRFRSCLNIEFIWVNFFVCSIFFIMPKWRKCFGYSFLLQYKVATTLFLF